MNKANSLAEQKRLIEEKKKEVLSKFTNQTGNENAEQFGPHFDPQQKIKSELEDQGNGPSNANTNPATPQTQLLMNDGNFMARFLEMQKQAKSGDAGTSSSSASRQSDVSTSGKITMKLAGVKKSEPAFQTTIARPSVFEEPEPDTEHNREEQSREAAEQLAQKVANEGTEAEAMARIQYQKDPNYRFLFDTSHPIHKVYQDKLKDLQSLNSESILGKRPRRNRWGEGPSTVTADSSTNSQPSTSGESKDSSLDIMAQFEIAKAAIQAKADILRGGKVAEDRERQRQMEEQKQIEAMYRRILAEQQIKQRAMQAQEQSGKPKYEYDSDEDTEDGTWEHKKRKQEMQKTSSKSCDLTDKGKGKHFLGDFLPPAELAKFMESFKAKKEGRDPDLSDYAEYKIKEDNIGYQMLQKAGWEAGKGLGSKGTGIVQPVNRNAGGFDNAGVGVEKPGQVEGTEDAFELYRKRMMLAYKFRPNPLNNPRRPYYS